MIFKEIRRWTVWMLRQLGQERPTEHPGAWEG